MALVAVLVIRACSGSGSDEEGDFRSVTLRQTGGIAALDRSVTLMSDGELSTGERFSDADLDELRLLIVRAEGTEIQPTYVPPGHCCDQFHYTLTIELDGRTIATETADGAAGPKVVEDIIGVLVSRLPTG